MKNKERKATMRLIATIDATSGRFTEFDHEPVQTRARPRLRPRFLMIAMRARWRRLPPQARMAIILLLTFLLGMIIDRLFLNGALVSLSEPVWKSFRLTR